MGTEDDITTLLRAWSAGDRSAGEKLTPLVYDELRRRAAGLFRRERPGHTLQPTALVHEAYARLIDLDIEWRERAHFYALATRMMRRLLVNHANAAVAGKRGGGLPRVTLVDDALPQQQEDIALVALSDALSALEQEDPRKAEIVELKYFGGLTTEEIADLKGLSTATVGRELRFARAWLKAQLDETE